MVSIWIRINTTINIDSFSVYSCYCTEQKNYETILSRRKVYETILTVNHRIDMK